MKNPYDYIAHPVMFFRKSNKKPSNTFMNLSNPNSWLTKHIKKTSEFYKFEALILSLKQKKITYKFPYIKPINNNLDIYHKIRLNKLSCKSSRTSTKNLIQIT